MAHGNATKAVKYTPTHPPIHVAPSQTGRKSVRPCDVADFVFAAPEMYWLKDEFREERRCGRERVDFIC